MDIRIEAVPEPRTAQDEPGWQLLGAARVSAVVEREIWGNDDLSDTARGMLSGLANQKNARKLRWVATTGADGADAVIGEAALFLPLHDNLRSASIYVAVLPELRRRGVGQTLWDVAARVAEEHGRTVLNGWSAFGVEPAADDPQALAAPTGSGRVPGDDPAVRFALARGYVLEQAERHSVLHLPVADAVLQRHLEEARRRAGDDYELVEWTDRVPDEWLDSYCVLQSRMSTDAPSAGLSWEEEVWTAERVRNMEQARTDAGLRNHVVAVLHRPSGELAGFTEIAVNDDKPEVGFQDVTIVRGDHRGHRLGMLLKAANLQRFAAREPQVRRIHTWNAEENAYMLSINVALGFVPTGGSAAWERKPSS